jgi:glutamyl-tRNA synthetase
MKNSLSLSKEEVDELMKNGHPYVIRFKVPEDVNITFTDIIRGTISINSAQMDDKVLVKSNGIPTYHMANVCDDHDMEVTHVIRGEEWIPSTPLHIMLYNAFGWKAPKFAHLPLLLNPDGKGKLSKRKSLQYGFPVFPFGGEAEDDKGAMVKYHGFKDQGYDSDALVNFLVLLGWSPGDDKELLTMAEMISEFSLDNVSKSGARFDIEKAKWFNSVYLKGRSNDDLLKDMDVTGSPFSYDNDKLHKIMDMAKNRSVFKHDLSTITDIFFKPLSLGNVDVSKIDTGFKTVMTEFITTNPEWTADGIKQEIFDICAEKSVKMGKIMPALRLALTGGLPGPDLPITMEVLGKKETFNRINNLLNLI